MKGMGLIKRRNWPWIAALMAVACLYYWTTSRIASSRARQPSQSVWRDEEHDYFWKNVPVHYPPSIIRPLPTSPPIRYPKIQLSSPHESAHDRDARLQRRLAVKTTFLKCWASYKRLAWAADELAPVSGGKNNPFGGWAATLVDFLDTLWIMGLKTEFEVAVAAAAEIDFTHTDLSEINVFETTIRYLGGFLAAYDLSGDARLLRKAVQVGEMLYKAFDTPNRMPVTRWDFHAAARGKAQSASSALVAEICSLSMEFTRLSQITGDSKWFDAVQRIAEVLAQQQESTALPGMWPLVVDTEQLKFNEGNVFTLGAMADSVYEYLAKMSALAGGQLPIYQTMYEKAADTAIKHNLFRPMVPKDDDILVAGIAHVDSGQITLEPQGQHLVCFLGGLFALGGKLFARSSDLDVAEKLVNGCMWAYRSSVRHIMPETFRLIPCVSKDECSWNETLWKEEVAKAADAKDASESADTIIAKHRLLPGFVEISDRRYILRPEAIESVFVLYRATKRPDLLEAAWDMFESINRVTSTDLANSAVWDVTIAQDQKPETTDSMESFWMGETLKYFYLIFSEDDLISLDEWVFNTEAHPLKRARR
ncbi:glycoside hydrolase family 47 protein [Moelleriella libera RCEF 2490]|uniref:alpha-1,2-Mannosidase n=1 Tax=Moelleriella libera RCEF 2490 TaxID=1081109 RepID=A0A167X7M0_9HYPO|nr:glycoside hydrolase family 47 protein [Moelleriella libera RCEF 2490]